MGAIAKAGSVVSKSARVPEWKKREALFSDLANLIGNSLGTSPVAIGNRIRAINRLVKEFSSDKKYGNRVAAVLFNSIYHDSSAEVRYYTAGRLAQTLKTVPLDYFVRSLRNYVFWLSKNQDFEGRSKDIRWNIANEIHKYLAQSKIFGGNNKVVSGPNGIVSDLGELRSLVIEMKRGGLPENAPDVYESMMVLFRRIDN